ncbi:MAG TPA: hypothetical protein VI197_08590 [Polyangiaceae bacterium]
MKRKRPAKTSIVPLVVLQAACAGVASVTPACGETERSGGGANSTNDGSSITTGVGGTVIVLAVNGFGGSIVLAVSGYGGVPNAATAISGTITSSGTTATSVTSSGTTGLSFGAGGSLIALAVAGFGGQLGAGGEAGALGEGGQAGARERAPTENGSDGPEGG